VKAFYKNGDSFVIAQCEFWKEFGIHRNRAVTSAHAIKTWVRNFKATGSTLKKKGSSVKTVCTPENIAVVREAIERSPHCSAHRHSVSLRLSEASVWWFLHKDLHFCPYKIHVTHALHERDYVNRVNFCQTFLQFEIHAKRSQNCHCFCKTFSQQKHIVLQSTAPLQLKHFKVGSKMAIAASTPVLLNQKKQCCKIARFTDASCI
jgi:transposase